MTPELLRFGHGAHPVVVVDGFTGQLPAIREIAAALAPFPEAQRSYYPGLRRNIAPADRAAHGYAEHILRKAVPLIGGAFDTAGFDWVGASFSMVTTAPGRLIPAQRAPHFDSTDRRYLAVLHYLSETPGTAFYRQRATGIEQVDDGNVRSFVATAQPAAQGSQGYITATDDHYEEIGRVEGKADRLVIYRGALLHSGIIPPDMELSPDPRVGRLTTNLFVMAR